MSKVDDELTRLLRRAERPVEGDALFEGLARRRSHRERVRRVQAGLLAFAVLAGTGVGFVALRDAFEPDDGPAISPSPVLPSNGEIVFARPLPGGSQHLFAVRPGFPGERLLTSGGTAFYRDPSVSPDGRTIAVVHSIPSYLDTNHQGVIATVPIDGGDPTPLTDPLRRVRDPAWSPDGTQIAFAGIETDQHQPSIFVMNADGSRMRLVLQLDGFTLSAPDWSGDGSTLVFTGLAAATSEAEQVNPDLYTVGIDGSGLTNLTQSPAVAEWSPSWSPRDDVIAYHRNEGTISNSVMLIDSGGRPTGVVFDDADAGEIGEVEFSPDGRSIAFTSELALTDSDDEGDLDVWTIRRDGTDLRNLTTGGAYGISWQPVPAGSSPTSPEPTIAPIPEGTDVGLGFNLCHADRLGGIDFLGRGADGFAWVGVPTKDDGTCPADAGAGAYVVVADIEGDTHADMWSDLSWRCDVLCTPYAAPDLDGDGAEELVVASHFSIMSYHVMRVEEYADGGMDIHPVFVAEPGHPPADLQGGEPIRIDAGGDEGYGSSIRCEGFPDSPVIVWSWAWSPVESEQPKEVHITRLQLQADGLFHVIGTNDHTVPWDETTGIADETPACGVDWHPNA